jgi:predicted FMN-binding regulatory protein PaiB
MDVPPASREARTNLLHDLNRRHSFGILISNLDGTPFPPTCLSCSTQTTVLCGQGFGRHLAQHA